MISLLLGVLTASALANAGTVEKFTVSGGYSYQVYTPKKVAAKPGLIVMLHGCTQNPQQMLTQTKMAAEADRKGFYLYLPQQSSSSNPWSCWTWWNPENQTRNSGGDSAFILSNMEKVIQEKNIDRSQVAVMGFSSGAGMASNFLSCFPDLFKAGLIHSGLEYAAAHNSSESFQVMRSGPSRQVDQTVDAALHCAAGHEALVPTYAVHGSSDNVVAPVNFQRLSKQFELMDAKISQSQGGRGEVTHAESDVPNAKLATKIDEVKVDGKVVLRTIFVQGMQHAWSGGDSAVQYAEPKGIPVSTMFMDEFFPENVE